MKIEAIYVSINLDEDSNLTYSKKYRVGQRYINEQDISDDDEIINEKTEEELLTIALKIKDDKRIPAIKAEAGRIILERYPEYKQRNATLGIYSQAYVDEMTAFIANVKNQSDALELDSTKTKNDFVVE